MRRGFARRPGRPSQPPSLPDGRTKNDLTRGFASPPATPSGTCPGGVFCVWRSIPEVDVRDHAGIEKGGDARAGAVEELVRDDHVAGVNVLAHAADGADGDDPFDAERLHAVEVGAEVDGGRIALVCAAMDSLHRLTCGLPGFAQKTSQASDTVHPNPIVLHSLKPTSQGDNPMRNWLKDNAAALLVLLAALALIHNSNNTVHHRLDDIRADTNQRIDAVVAIIDRLQNAMNQRFDAQDERLDSLAGEVSGLRKLTVGITSNECPATKAKST